MNHKEMLTLVRQAKTMNEHPLQSVEALIAAAAEILVESSLNTSHELELLQAHVASAQNYLAGRCAESLSRRTGGLVASSELH